MKKENPAKNENALKHLVGPQLLKKIASSLEKIDISFKTKKFLAYKNLLDPLEMKPRVRLIRDALKESLPPDYPRALEIILKSIRNGDIRGFDTWPYAEFIQLHGLDHPKQSLEALKEVTKVFTAEWAVRPFIKSHPELTIEFLLRCAKDKNVHLRRWSSEGSRPRLPWGERLQEFVRDPSPTLPILEKLKFDPELYVRKSVANHLNDIAKDHPQIVMNLLTDWQKQAHGEAQKRIEWLIYRSLRTLIKQGNSRALKLIGAKKASVKVESLTVLKPNIKLGDRLDFEFNIYSTTKKSQKLVIDYIIHFVKANKKQAAKVFKLKTFVLEADGSIKVKKSHHLKKITTRDYYSGAHVLEIQVNGISSGKIDWHLTV